METKEEKVYYRCKKCGIEIHWNTHKRMTYCKCGAIAVDGCEFYVRLIGNQDDMERVEKNEDGITNTIQIKDIKRI